MTPRRPAFALNWNDILSKLVVTLIPLTLGYFAVQKQDSQRSDLSARHDSLLVAFVKSGTIDTLQNRQIRQFHKVARRSSSVSDTTEVRRPSALRRWGSGVWARIKSPFTRN